MVFSAGHGGEGEVSLGCGAAQLEALDQPLDRDLVGGELGQTGQQLGGLGEDGVGVDTVDAVAHTLHHLAKSHRATELQHSAQLDLNTGGVRG